jgi:hypothetical protein
MDNPERQVVCGSVSLDCPFFITPSLTGFVLFVVLSLWIVHSSLSLPVREGVMKNRQSRETERQTTQNQLEKE